MVAVEHRAPRLVDDALVQQHLQRGLVLGEDHEVARPRLLLRRQVREVRSQEGEDVGLLDEVRGALVAAGAGEAVLAVPEERPRDDLHHVLPAEAAKGARDALNKQPRRELALLVRADAAVEELDEVVEVAEADKAPAALELVAAALLHALELDVRVRERAHGLRGPQALEALGRRLVIALYGEPRMKFTDASMALTSDG